MDLRRPLKALPLACFLPPENASDPRASPYKSATKRSRSPSALLSPAKRRILREEGCLASPSLSGMTKSASRGRVSERDARPRRRFETGLLSMLSGESNRDCSDPSFVDAVTHKVRSAASSTRDTSSSEAGHTSPKRSVRLSSNKNDGLVITQRVLTPLMVPRELPPCPDPQSCHYPGFDVYYDTHIEIPSTATRFNPETEFELDKEGTKENLPPRKKAKKVASVPAAVVLSGLFRETTSDKPKAFSYPTTPYRHSSIHTPATPHVHKTPFSIARVAHRFTPGRTTCSTGSNRAMKRALEQEVDEVCSDAEGDLE